MRDEGQRQDTDRWPSQDPPGWYEARDAVGALRDVLLAAGLAKHFPYLRADVNAFGQGIVEIGRTTPEGATRIAELIGLGLAVRPAVTDLGQLISDTSSGASEQGMS